MYYRLHAVFFGQFLEACQPITDARHLVPIIHAGVPMPVTQLDVLNAGRAASGIVAFCIVDVQAG